MPTDQTATPMIDHSQVAELIEAIGVDDFLDIIMTLDHEVGEQIATLQQRCSSGNVDGIHKTAHRLAGLLSQFGARRVAEQAEFVREAACCEEATRLALAFISLCHASMTAINTLPLHQGKLAY